MWIDGIRCLRDGKRTVMFGFGEEEEEEEERSKG